MRDVQRDYELALADFCDRLQQDRTVVAAVLWGSLAHDVVWEKSDIDLCIVRDDQKARAGTSMAALTSHGVNIHASVMTRAGFRKMLQQAVGGEFFQSINQLGRILFTRDESLRQIFEEARILGDRDRRQQLLNNGCYVVGMLDKCEKWLRVKQDPHYSALYIAGAWNAFASIELLLRGEIPGREALLRAVELNPAVFRRWYVEFSDEPKTVDLVSAALDALHAYMDANRDALYGPIFEYLAEQATICSSEDLEQHFTRTMDVQGVTFACEWLAARGLIGKASAPYYLTQHSRVELEQLAFYMPEDKP